MTDDKIEIAKSISNIWFFMTAQQQDMFLEHMEIEHYMETEVIFHEGDIATHTFYVYQGRVKNEMLGLDNKQHVISMAPAGHIFASQSPFSESVYNCTCHQPSEPDTYTCCQKYTNDCQLPHPVRSEVLRHQLQGQLPERRSGTHREDGTSSRTGYG